nr:protein PFC0760c-like [Maniola hyperantus]
MCVKLLLLGTAFFVSILEKSDATNKKCYSAKICIHDGKEKCGQDMKVNVQRFLDSCDMKEYNCLKNANYRKTNAKNCQNLPSIDNKQWADDKVTDNNDAHDGSKNEANANESKGDDDDEANGLNNVNSDVRDSKETEYDHTIQEVEANKGNGINSVSNEDVPDGESKEDDEVNRAEKKPESCKENKVSKASKEDGTNRVSKEDETGETDKEQTDDEDDENEIDEADEEPQDDEVYKDNIVNESEGADGDYKADQASKEDNEKGSHQENTAKKLYYGLQEGYLGTTDEANYNDNEILIYISCRINCTSLSNHPNDYDNPIVREKLALFYCFKLKTCTPGGDPVCGFDEIQSFLAEFEDKCTLYKVNCVRKGLFTLVDAPICEGQKKFLSANRDYDMFDRNLTSID